VERQFRQTSGIALAILPSKTIKETNDPSGVKLAQKLYYCELYLYSLCISFLQYSIENLPMNIIEIWLQFLLEVNLLLIDQLGVVKNPFNMDHPLNVHWLVSPKR